jgi:hypothetical protein
MTLESDKKVIVTLLKFLEDKEVELTVYRTLFLALNHSYPEEKLPQKFQGMVESPVGFQIRQKYAGLGERVQKTQDLNSLVAEVLKWTESRAKRPS